MSTKNVRKIEIFISSPSDVASERKIVKQVVERLRRKQRLSSRFTFEALAYEDHVPPIGGDGPQTTVNKYMKQPHECEIFICLFWHRMGTPTITNGEAYDSGTHFEFVDAYRANQTTGFPIILLYRGQKAYPLTVDGQQLAKVNQFFQKFHGSDAEYKGLYRTYSSDDEFERLLLDDIESVITLHFDVNEMNSTPDLWSSVLRNINFFTQHMLGVRYKEKYSPAYYSPRPEIVEHFKSFINGDKVLMIVTGKAGTGKSSFVSDIATKPQDNLIVWLQDCAILQLESNANIDDYIHQSLGLPENITLLSALEALSRQKPNQTLLFLFDAVNEYESPSTLLKKISDLVIRINIPNLKVMVTCRLPAWNTLKRFLEVPVVREFHPAGPNSHVSFADSFSDSEMPGIYALYQESYSLKTNFSDLPKTVKEFITQPLFLKLMAVAFQGKFIPQKLSLREVLRRYIDYCLRIDTDTQGNTIDYESLPEFQVLRAAVQLMYDKAKREINLSSLKENLAVGSYISVDLSTRTPYTHLVNEGLLSQQISEEFAQRIEIVFVTYERVFEYLLARFNIDAGNIKTIQDALDTSRRLSFLQLRGAAELSLTFAITEKLLEKAKFIDLAKNDRPEVRQFLVDVLQTTYSSGYRPLVEEIISDLISVKEGKDTTLQQANAANQLAVQAVYQLRLDEQLVNFAMSKKTSIRDLAALYIYQRWNKARLDGRLAEAYIPIETIAKRIRILPVPLPGAIQAFSALASVSLNLMAHVIDDIDSLVPLLHIWQNIIRQIPGIDPRPNGGLFNAITRRITETLIDIVAQVMSSLAEKSIVGNADLLNRFWADPKSERAFLDVSVLFNETSLLQHEARVRTLLAWENEIVSYALMCTLIHHVYQDPDEHLQMLQRIFYDVESYVFRTRYEITIAIAFAGLSRILRGKPIDDDYTYQVEANLYELWRMLADSEDVTQPDLLGADPTDALGLLFLVLMHIEALKQISEGKIYGSEMLVRFIEALGDELSDSQIKILIKSVENVAYLGFADFAVLTLLQDQVLRIWQEKAPQAAISSLANIRSFYQDEVDSLFAQRKDIKSSILNEVRLIGTIPDTKDVLFATANLWLVSCAIEPAMTKMSGNIMGNLVFFSKSLKDFLRSSSRTLITALFDFEAINVTHFQWGRLHDPEWDNFEAWQVPRDIDTKQKDAHEYWREVIGKFIAENGRGIVYDEL